MDAAANALLAPGDGGVARQDVSPRTSSRGIPMGDAAAHLAPPATMRAAWHNAASCGNRAQLSAFTAGR